MANIPHTVNCETNGVLGFISGNSTNTIFNCNNLPVLSEGETYNVLLTRIGGNGIRFEFDLLPTNDTASLQFGNNVPTYTKTDIASGRYDSVYINKPSSMPGTHIVTMGLVSGNQYNIQVFTRSGTLFNLLQTIPIIYQPAVNTTSSRAVISDDGNYLFFLSSRSVSELSIGVVTVYRFNGTTYQPQSVINPPNGISFGPALDINHSTSNPSIYITATDGVYLYALQGEIWRGSNVLPTDSRPTAITAEFNKFAVTVNSSVIIKDPSNRVVISEPGVILGQSISFSFRVLAITKSPSPQEIRIYNSNSYELVQTIPLVDRDLGLETATVALNLQGTNLVAAVPGIIVFPNTQTQLQYYTIQPDDTFITATTIDASTVNTVLLSMDYNGAITAAVVPSENNKPLFTIELDEAFEASIVISEGADITAKYTPSTRTARFDLFSSTYTYLFEFTDDSFTSFKATLSTTNQATSVIGSSNSNGASNILNFFAYNESVTPAPQQCNFTRGTPISTGTGCICCAGESDPNNPNLVRSPRIYMTIQTTMNGYDIAQAIFNICDDYDYGDNCRPKRIRSRCDQNRFIPRTSVITSTFNYISPYISCIVVGRGNGLTEKVAYLQRQGVRNATVAAITQYAMAKWILSVPLYGEPKLKYLLRSWNTRFFKDLANSRFCRFVNFFKCPQYTDYRKLFVLEYEDVTSCSTDRCNDRRSNCN